MELSEAEDRARGHMAAYGFALGGATQLLHLLLARQGRLDTGDLDILRAAWPARVPEAWAETVDAAVAFLLKTTLAKAGKADMRALPGPSLGGRRRGRPAAPRV